MLLGCRSEIGTRVDFSRPEQSSRSPTRGKPRNRSYQVCSRDVEERWESGAWKDPSLWELPWPPLAFKDLGRLLFVLGLASAECYTQRLG